ncbi:hypothetical protein [Longispora fulva]|uniref:Uncharacterized protein n=1 Tax=Longispora fulva TaxID=619741 RepID=A0A8J7GT56_9ACTN|nr:hypothetical protein [Longispora fulva]MBG6136681.1 hypothetical protein [Longispora fulva]
MTRHDVTVLAIRPGSARPDPLINVPAHRFQNLRKATVTTVEV